jgi:hypothetical protein
MLGYAALISRSDDSLSELALEDQSALLLASTERRPGEYPSRRLVELQEPTRLE